MTIIFDFNRTLYEPELGALMPGALEVLALLAQKGAILHLVSRLELGREALPGKLGIEDFFTSIQFVADKKEALHALITTTAMPVYVVGDHLHDEIRTGNKLGAKTIRFKQGKFASLMPEEPDDEPWRTVEHLKDLSNFV